MATEPGKPDANAHADLDGGLEVDQPAHPGVDGLDGIGGRRCRRCAIQVWLRSDRELVRDRVAGDGEDADVGVVAEGDPAIGHQRRARRARPGRGMPGRGREIRHRNERFAVGDGRARTQGEIARLELARDPRRALRLESTGELRPGGAFALRGGRLSAGAPHLLPVRLTPGDLVVGQLRFVGVDVQVIRVDTDQQVGTATVGAVRKRVSRRIGSSTIGTPLSSAGRRG